MSGEYLYGHRVAASLEEEQETRNHLVWPAVDMKNIFSSIQSMFPLFFLVNPQTRINNVLLSPINQLWDTLSIGKAKGLTAPLGNLQLNDLTIGYRASVFHNPGSIPSAWA